MKEKKASDVLNPAEIFKFGVSRLSIKPKFKKQQKKKK
jgi:hypothetical protein